MEQLARELRGAIRRQLGVPDMVARSIHRARQPHDGAHYRGPRGRDQLQRGVVLRCLPEHDGLRWRLGRVRVQRDGRDDVRDLPHRDRQLHLPHEHQRQALRGDGRVEPPGRLRLLRLQRSMRAAPIPVHPDIRRRGVGGRHPGNAGVRPLRGGRTWPDVLAGRVGLGRR